VFSVGAKVTVIVFLEPGSKLPFIGSIENPLIVSCLESASNSKSALDFCLSADFVHPISKVNDFFSPTFAS
jgi:hypothetical protein